MEGGRKPNKQPAAELATLRERVRELEALQAGRRKERRYQPVHQKRVSPYYLAARRSSIMVGPQLGTAAREDVTGELPEVEREGVRRNHRRG